jgi:hypothetical protein
MTLFDAASIGITCKGFELMQLLYKFRLLDAIELPISDNTLTKALNEFEALLNRAEALSEYHKCSLLYNTLPVSVQHLFRYENVDGVGARIEHKELRTMKLRIFEQCGALSEELRKLKGEAKAATPNATTTATTNTNSNSGSQKRKAETNAASAPKSAASGGKDSGGKGRDDKSRSSSRGAKTSYRDLSTVTKEERTPSKTNVDDFYYIRGMTFDQRRKREEAKQCITCDLYHPTETCEHRFEAFKRGDFFYYPRLPA